ncbi:MAG: YceI family protein [Alphaproteobacteria bacterium]|nr:YceI family protein [Alphaproteobacteria bacterium]
MRQPLFAAALLAAFLAGAPARATETYAIDQRFGEIGFSVRHLGLFGSEGQFGRWQGQLAIDQAHPERTRIAVTIDTGSAQMSWHEALAMLRSPAYFDVAQFPEARFTSTAVTSAGPDRYTIAGDLQLRGVVRPITLQARLVDHVRQGQADIADFVVTGALQRSAFGMTSDSSFVSDRVGLEIRARVRLDEAARGD